MHKRLYDQASDPMPHIDGNCAIISAGSFASPTGSNVSVSCVKDAVAAELEPQQRQQLAQLRQLQGGPDLTTAVIVRVRGGIEHQLPAADTGLRESCVLPGVLPEASRTGRSHEGRRFVQDGT